MAPLKIGIIGAGMIGVPLARHLVRIGHTVRIANTKGPDSADLQKIAADTGATASTAADAAAGADVVVITIPFKAVASLPKDLLDATPKNAVIIDTNNYYPLRDGVDGVVSDLQDGTLVESEWVQRHLGRGDRKVVKVINNIYAHRFTTEGKPKGDPARLALPLSGDNEAHKRVVIDLLDAIGFDAVDNGPISESWRHEPGTPVYTLDNTKEQVVALLAQAKREDKLANRQAANQALIDFIASLKK